MKFSSAAGMENHSLKSKLINILGRQTNITVLWWEKQNSARHFVPVSETFDCAVGRMYALNLAAWVQPLENRRLVTPAYQEWSLDIKPGVSLEHHQKMTTQNKNKSQNRVWKIF